MKKYNVIANYVCTKYIGEIEANSEEEAIEIAYKERLVDGYIKVCLDCSKTLSSELLLLEDSVRVEIEE